MSACYCCHRNEDEIKEELHRAIKAEFDDEEKFVRMEMEDERKKVLDLQEEWERVKKQAAANLSSVFTVDLFSILGGGNSPELNSIKAFMGNAERVLGDTIKNINPATIEQEIRDKVEGVKNLGEFNERMKSARESYDSRKAGIENETGLMRKKSIKIGAGSIELTVCKICSPEGA